MAYGDEYDPNATGSPDDPHAGMVWNPATGQWEPAQPQAGDNINPLTGQPYTGLAPVGGSVNDPTPPGLHYDNSLTIPKPPDLNNDVRGGTDTPAGPGTLGALGGLGQPGTLTAPFTDTFTRPPLRDLPQVPGLTLPSFRGAAPFRDTTAADITADPGYAFLLGEGQKGVAQSAAARGLLNSGGTLKDIAKWTEDYAGTRFNDVDQRRRGDYLLNYQTQTLDPYKFAYQSALDSFAPQLTGYTTNAADTQHRNDADETSAWNQFLQKFNQFKDQRDSTWDKASTVLLN